MRSLHDPDVIHECKRCGRSYAVRPIKGMNHWHFYNVFCSLFCAKSNWDWWVSCVEAWGESTIFKYFLAGAEQVYNDLLHQLRNHNKVIHPHYYIGWHYSDAHPYRFASEFMDRVERMMFLSARERADFANDLFSMTNNMHQEFSDGQPQRRVRRLPR